MKCHVNGCKCEAKHQIGWRAWAEGYPKTTAPLVAYMALGVCDECRDEMTIEDFLLPEGKERIQGVLLANKKIPLDFSTAELCFHDIIDGKFQGFENANPG